MPVAAGWLFAAAILLGGAGVAKLVRPAVVTQALQSARIPGLRHLRRVPIGRISGFVEVVIAAGALAFGNRLTSALVACAYLVFAAVAARMLAVRSNREPCGCFGEVDAPVSPVHVVVDLAAAAAALAATWSPPGSVLDLAHGQPLSGLPFAVATLALAWLGYLAFTAVPALLDAQRSVAPPEPQR
ncbi:MAG TPA: MauE/DoxX family redox-associated membrane protein [Acidimicrobiales bacterium]|jgi:hypothetical protein|nr:MauE/DoxX family redox-associated membrane protein [Acidimicrobiales bacterium]